MPSLILYIPIHSAQGEKKIFRSLFIVDYSVSGISDIKLTVVLTNKLKIVVLALRL